MPPVKKATKAVKVTKKPTTKVTKKTTSKPPVKTYNLLDKGIQFHYPHLKNSFQQYASEFLGTAVLTFLVTLNLGYNETLISTPLLAALILGFFVYTLGSKSGAHLNPAVTLALFATRVINYQKALFYILSQIFGAMVAISLYLNSSFPLPFVTPINAYPYNLFEALGTALLVFGIMAVATKKVSSSASGLVAGLSLFLGITTASVYSLGLINPAIAISWQLVDTTYLLSPLLGALVAGIIFRLLND